MTVEEKLELIKDACESKKGTDIKILNIGDMTSIAEYFVIVSGNSSTQSQSIADAVEENLLKENIRPENIVGKNSARWILLDYGDIMVHVFHKDERDYYDLERLWTKEEIEN